MDMQICLGVTALLPGHELGYENHWNNMQLPL